MEEELRKFLNRNKEIPSPYLKWVIWNVVENRIHKSKNNEMVIFSFTTVLSLTGFVFAFMSLYQNFISSNIMNYLSLIVSDFAVVQSMWKEFLYVLLESLPVMSVVLTFGVATLALFSINKTFSSFKEFYSTYNV